MKRFLLTLLFACAAPAKVEVALPAQLPSAQPTAARSDAAWRPDERFRIHIEQDRRPVAVRDHYATLARRPFALVFELQSVEMIEINASFDARTFNRAASRATLTGDADPFGPARGMAEERDHPGRTIFLDDDAFNYWGWSTEVQRCHEHRSRGGITLCKRFIDALTVGGTLTTLDDTSVSTLYLVILAADETKNAELQRDWLALTFR